MDETEEQAQPDKVHSLNEAEALEIFWDKAYEEIGIFLSKIIDLFFEQAKNNGAAPDITVMEKYMTANVICAFALMAENGSFPEEINKKFKENPVVATKQLYEDLFLLGKNVDENEEIANIIPNLLSIIPDKHLIPNNKLANTMTKGIVDMGTIELEVSKQRAKKQVNTICNLAYEGDKVKLTGRQSFTEYDRNVYNAVTSLFVYGDHSHIVTPDIVYRTMTGMNDTQDPSPQQVGAVTKSLDKMRFIRARIDVTQEFQQRRLSLNGEHIVNGIIDTYLLNADVLQVQAGGQVVRAYRINKTPILYAYSRAVNQVITIPSALLDIRAIDSKTGQATGKRISNTETRIQLKGYLLRRIGGMKCRNALKNHNIALYGYEKDGEQKPGLYQIAGNPNPNRKDAERIRDYISHALDYWTAENYIKGYTWTKTGRQISGVEINP